MLLIIGIILGLSAAVDIPEETMPAVPNPPLINMGTDLPLIQKPTIATHLQGKDQLCTVYCESDGHCSSERFYECVRKNDDVNFGVAGRQLAAFDHGRRVQTDTANY